MGSIKILVTSTKQTTEIFLTETKVSGLRKRFTVWLVWIVMAILMGASCVMSLRDNHCL
jgi:hypothetical protein